MAAIIRLEGHHRHRGFASGEPAIHDIIQQGSRKSPTHSTPFPDDADFSPLVNCFAAYEAGLMLKETALPTHWGASHSSS
jgi:hypothetical protein